MAVSPDNCTCCAVAADVVFCTSAAVCCKNCLVVVFCALILANSASAASYSTTNWSMGACILAVGGNVRTGVDLHIAGFLPSLGPAEIDGVTVIAGVVIGSSFEEVGASVISSLEH